MDEVESGSFGGGNVIEANMSNGGISLGKFSDKVSSDVQSKIKDYADKISADEFLTNDEINAIKDTLG